MWLVGIRLKQRVIERSVVGGYRVRVEEPVVGSQEFISVKATRDLKSLCWRSPFMKGKKKEQGNLGYLLHQLL